MYYYYYKIVDNNNQLIAYKRFRVRAEKDFKQEFYDTKNWVSITEDEYLKLQQQSPQQEQIIQQQYDYNSTRTLIDEYYTHAYSILIYFLYHAGLIKYKWIPLKEIGLYKDHGCHIVDKGVYSNGTGNLYLRFENRPMLLNDILNRGMYFPFIGYGNTVLYGSHRLHLLQDYYASLSAEQKEKEKDKCFLFLDFSPVGKSYNIFLKKDFPSKELNKEIMIPILAVPTYANSTDIKNVPLTSYSLQIINIKNTYFLLYYFFYCIDSMGSWIFDYKDFIPPSIILNNKSAFEEFIHGN